MEKELGTRVNVTVQLFSAFEGNIIVAETKRKLK